MGAVCSSQQREDGHVLTRSCLQPTAVTQMQTFNSSLSHEKNAQPSTHTHTQTLTHTLATGCLSDLPGALMGGCYCRRRGKKAFNYSSKGEKEQLQSE